MRSECPMNKEGKMDKKMKKAMVATWFNNDISLKTLLLFLYIQSFAIFYMLIELIMLHFMIQVLNMDKGQIMQKRHQRQNGHFTQNRTSYFLDP